MFDEKSRYAGLPTRSLALPDGRAIAYVTRRIVPPAESYVAAGGATVTDSDRLDHLAYRHLGTPAGFYQVADANEAMHPQSLTAVPGRRIVIPLPLAAGGRR
jgi:hypothetical protein